MSDPTDFLYPMVDPAIALDSTTDLDDLLDDLDRSAEEKIRQSAAVTADALATHAERLDAIADAMADRLGSGGRIFTCGNGGSATDADGVADLFRSPPAGRPVAALSLVTDMAVLTALANDVGFDVVFARQVMAHGTERDVLVGFSTSGNSANVIAAMRAAHDHGLLTVGIAGGTGGHMADSDAIDHCVVVAADSIHRIQEAQSAIAFALWRRVQDRLAAVAPTATSRTAP